MARLLTITLFLALAATAQAAPRHHAARHHAVSHHRRYARARLRHFSVEMKADNASSARSYRPVGPREAYMRPSVETPLGETGGIASFGYHPGSVGQTLGPHELNGAAEPQLGHAESTAGVSVKVPL